MYLHHNVIKATHHKWSFRIKQIVKWPWKNHLPQKWWYGFKGFHLEYPWSQSITSMMYILTIRYVVELWYRCCLIVIAQNFVIIAIFITQPQRIMIFLIFFPQGHDRKYGIFEVSKIKAQNCKYPSPNWIRVLDWGI